VHGTVKCCVVTALRSFIPAKPTSNGLHPATRASSRATHSVFAPRLRTTSSACGPAPAASKPRISSTTKSSGDDRSTPLASGAPQAYGGVSAASRQ
jgi:hypothetical protein